VFTWAIGRPLAHRQQVMSAWRPNPLLVFGTRRAQCAPAQGMPGEGIVLEPDRLV